MPQSTNRRRTRRHKPALRRPDRTRHSRRRLFAETLETRVLLTTVASLNPPANSHNAPASTDIAATFDLNINGATASVQTFAVNSQQGGPLLAGAATVAVDGATVTLNPTSDFYPGELVQVTATSAIQSTSADPVVPHVWQFRTGVAGGSGEFLDSGQDLGVGANNTQSIGVALGDLDGDGDLDAFFANIGTGNGVYLNEGGVFTDSGQSLGTGGGEVALGDFDGDGDLDAFVVTGGANQVWQNDGSAVFTAGQSLGSSASGKVAIGDFDGDGDLDAFVANGGYSNNANRVWINTGGTFRDSGQAIGSHTSNSVAIGDVDGDGDLDAFVTNYGQDLRVWLNNGSGTFSDNGQNLPGSETNNVALGDIDGDGDLDAFVVNNNQPDRVWFNDGSGTFTDSGQQLGGNNESDSVSLGDVDADGDLDAMIANYLGQGNRFFVNDGNGAFTDSGQFMGNRNSRDLALGDVNGDGALDFVVANTNHFQNIRSTNRVWLNQNLTPSVTLSVDATTIPEAAGTATVTATLSAAHTAVVTVDLETSGTATVTDDYSLSGTQIVIPMGAMSGAITITSVQDVVDEPDETVVVDISAATNAQESGIQQAIVTILDDDEPPVPDVTLAIDAATIAEAAGVANFTISLSEATTVPVTVDLSVSGTAAAGDYAVSGTQVVIAAGATSGAISVTAVQDEVDEADETVIIDITNVAGGNEVGDQQETTTILDDDIPPSFAVTSLEATDSGFVLQFTNPLDGGDLNLYDTQNAGMGAADVVVRGGTSGNVSGSLIVGERSVEFVKSGGPMEADTYRVTLRSATDGFEDTGGMTLDGNGDGTGGDDYVNTWTVAAVPDGARTVSIPDFVRGPGQDVNLPADRTTGIPITISEGDNVRAADLRITYDPALLEITGATAPAGGSVIVNTTTTPGVAILVFFSSASLPAGSTTFINVQATVPTADASANYGLQQVLDLHSVTIGDGNDNEFAIIVDDAHHFATYFADVSGNGRINASDAAQVARFAALIDAGFAGSLNVDPINVGDISGNGRINAADASRVAQFAALIDVPEVPPVPGGIRITGLVNPGLRIVGTIPIIVNPAARLSKSDNAAESVTSDFRVVENFASQGSDDQIAVDQMMADLANSVDGELGEPDSVTALAGTLDELLSAID